MFKKLSFLFFFVAFGIGITSAMAGGFVTPSDVPAGYVAYVRANASQFLQKGDVIFVKDGLNPKIDGFVLSDNTEKVKELISGSIDLNLSPVKSRKTGEIIAYGWGSFDYNSAFNKVTPPKAGTNGKDSGGGGDSSGHGGSI